MNGSSEKKVPEMATENIIFKDNIIFKSSSAVAVEVQI